LPTKGIFRIEVFDSVFLADSEKGTVVEQHPRAGFKVKKEFVRSFSP